MESGDHLGLILAAWADLLRSGDTQDLASILDEHVVWQGLRPELVCHNREQVLDVLSRSRPALQQLTRIEAEQFGNRVAVSVAGPDFPENEVLAAGAPRSLVFTFRDGKVVRMESFPSREAAFELAAR